MPGMNGYRLAQSLRARSRVAVRLVMLSGMTLDDTTVRLSLSAGFDDCIDKAAGPKALGGARACTGRQGLSGAVQRRLPLRDPRPDG